VTKALPIRVRQAVSAILARDELEYTRLGRRVLRRALLAFARELNREAQIDVHELLDVVEELDN